MLRRENEMNNYKPVKVNATGMAKKMEIEVLFTDLENALADKLNEYGREWSIVKTNLQTASMFMVRAVAVENQIPEALQSDNAQ